MFRLNLPRPRRRRTGLTLVLWAPHPAQGDFHRALRTAAEAMRNGPVFHSERTVGRLTSNTVRDLLEQAERQRKPVLIEAGLLPETKLFALSSRLVRDVRQVLARTSADKVQIVLLVAPQDRLIETVYARRAEHGVAGSFEEHLAQFSDVDLSYAPLIRELESLPQVQAVRALDWSVAEKRLAPLLGQVLETATGSAGTDVLKRFDRPAKVRGFASRRGVRVAKAMHEFVETDKERRLVRTMVRETFPARRFNDLKYLNDDDRQRLKDRYRDDRRVLKSAGKS